MVFEFDICNDNNNKSYYFFMVFESCFGHKTELVGEVNQLISYLCVCKVEIKISLIYEILKIQ